MSKTVYEESVSHLTEVFHQSDNMLRELTDKNLTYLHIWGENLQNTSNEDDIMEIPALSEITIFAMTANAFEEDRKKALECGMDGFYSSVCGRSLIASSLRKYCFCIKNLRHRKTVIRRFLNIIN